MRSFVIVLTICSFLLQKATASPLDIPVPDIVGNLDTEIHYIPYVEGKSGHHCAFSPFVDIECVSSKQQEVHNSLVNAIAEVEKLTQNQILQHQKDRILAILKNLLLKLKDEMEKALGVQNSHHKKDEIGAKAKKTTLQGFRDTLTETGKEMKVVQNDLKDAFDEASLLRKQMGTIFDDPGETEEDIQGKPTQEKVVTTAVQNVNDILNSALLKDKMENGVHQTSEVKQSA